MNVANISAGAAAITCFAVAAGPSDLHRLIVLGLAAYAIWHVVMAARRGEVLLAAWTGILVAVSLLKHFNVPKPF